MKTNIHFGSYRAQFFLEWQRCGEKQTHILSSTTGLKNRAVCEKMWKNNAQPDRPQMKIRRMRIACWIPKATDTHTHTLYVTLIAFPQQQWLHERTSLLRR